MKRTALAAATLFAALAFAHGAEQHLKGTIQKVDGTTITLQPEKGEPVALKTNDKTEFKMGDAACTLKDVTVGQRAVVNATKHDGALLALVVKLPPAAPKPEGK